MFSFRTSHEMLVACLPRQPIERFGHPKKAYVYIVLCKKGRAKVGQTTNPSVRVREVCGCKCYKAVTQILIVGPTKSWRELEERLLTALQCYLARPPLSNVLYDDFLLPDEIAASISECFANDCSNEALERLERIVKAGPIDYEI